MEQQESTSGPLESDESPLAELSIEQLRAELDQAKSEAEALKDRYLRAMAEIENTRRRTEKEKSELLQFGLERFMVDLLPVMDSVENAIRDLKIQKEPNLDSLSAGFDLTKKQLEDVLLKHGLTAVQSEGTKFDPNLHQAIQKLESDDIDVEMVKQVFVKGYALNGRLIRAAMVSVEVPKGT